MKNLLFVFVLFSSFSIVAQDIRVEDTNGDEAILRATTFTFNSSDNVRKFNFFSNTNVNNPTFSLNYQLFSSNGVITDNIFNFDANESRIGIGTTSPQTLFHVERGNQPQALFGASGGLLAYVTINQPTSASSSTDAIFRVRDNGNTKFRVNENGNTYQVDIIGAGRISSMWMVSDKRLKKQIQPLDKMLAKISRLRPSAYQFRHEEKALGYLNLPKEDQFGFVAQEVQKVFPNLVKSSLEYDENGKALGTLHTVNYTGFIPILLAGIQEQQQLLQAQAVEIKALKDELSKVDGLLDKINELAQKIANFPDQSTNSPILIPSDSKAKLFQNQPNPFRDYTTIPYFLPKHIQKATLRISNVSGEVLKTIVLTERGQGQIDLQTSLFPAGNYFYTLSLNGRIIETKQMILNQ